MANRNIPEAARDGQFLARLAHAWTRYCSKLQMRLNEGTGDGSDSSEQSLQQWEATYREELLAAMGAPLGALKIPRRLRLAFEHRRNGIADDLFALDEQGGRSPPTVEQLRFKAFVARTAVEMNAAGTTLDETFQRLAKATAWTGTTTPSSIRHWYEDRETNTRFGRYYIGLYRDLPNLRGVDLMNWLITEISSPNGKAASL